MKVAIIGAGDVGSATAQRIIEADLADVVLMDIVKGKAQAKALDLMSASSIVRHCRCISGTSDHRDIKGADIVVITAGQARSPGQKREELLLKNARIVEEVSRKITHLCIGSIVIVVTNPVDVMAYLVHKITRFPAHQIIGMGGTSDCARFNMLVAAELNIESQHIHSIIIGPHADNMLILPRFSTVLGTRITDLLPKDRIEKIVKETRNFGARIVKLMGKGSASYGPSAGIFLLVDSIINDRKSILCVSSYLSGQYALKELYIGVPAKVGRMGIEETIELKLNKKEKLEFLSSAKSVKRLIKNLGV